MWSGFIGAMWRRRPTFYWEDREPPWENFKIGVLKSAFQCILRNHGVKKDCAILAIKQPPCNPTSKNSKEVGYFEVVFPLKQRQNREEILTARRSNLL